MADFLPQTVLNVNYGRQGSAVFQLTLALHFVCWQMVEETSAPTWPPSEMVTERLEADCVHFPPHH